MGGATPPAGVPRPGLPGMTSLTGMTGMAMFGWPGATSQWLGWQLPMLPSLPAAMAWQRSAFPAAAGAGGPFASFRSSGGHAMAPIAALMAAAMLLTYAIPNLPAPFLHPWHT